MTFVQKLWRAELIGLVSLVIVACLVLALLVLYSLIFSDVAASKLSRPSELMAGVQTFGLIILWGLAPVILYGAPVFATYLPNPAPSAWKLMLCAIVPGTVIQLFSFGFGMIVLVGGIGVAATMLLVHWKIRPA